MQANQDQAADAADTDSVVRGYSAQQIMQVLERLGLPSGASQLVQTRNVVPGLAPTGGQLRNYKGLVKIAPGKYTKKPVRCYTSLDCMVIIWVYITSCRSVDKSALGLSGRIPLRTLAASGFADGLRRVLTKQWDAMDLYYREGGLRPRSLMLPTSINLITVDIQGLYSQVRKELEELFGTFHMEIGDYGSDKTDNSAEAGVRVSNNSGHSDRVYTNGADGSSGSGRY